MTLNDLIIAETHGLYMGSIVRSLYGHTLWMWSLFVNPSISGGYVVTTVEGRGSACVQQKAAEDFIHSRLYGPGSRRTTSKQEPITSQVSLICFVSVQWLWHHSRKWAVTLTDFNVLEQHCSKTLEHIWSVRSLKLETRYLHLSSDFSVVLFLIKASSKQWLSPNRLSKSVFSEKTMYRSETQSWQFSSTTTNCVKTSSAQFQC